MKDGHNNPVTALSSQKSPWTLSTISHKDQLLHSKK